MKKKLHPVSNVLQSALDAGLSGKTVFELYRDASNARLAGFVKKGPRFPSPVVPVVTKGSSNGK